MPPRAQVVLEEDIRATVDGDAVVLEEEKKGRMSVLEKRGEGAGAAVPYLVSDGAVLDGQEIRVDVEGVGVVSCGLALAPRVGVVP